MDASGTYTLKCDALPGACHECCKSDDCQVKFSDPHRVCNFPTGFGMCQCDTGYKLCTDSTGKRRCLDIRNDPENCGNCKWEGGDCRIFFNKDTCVNGVCQ